jgi:hypothetical protein
MPLYSSSTPVTPIPVTWTDAPLVTLRAKGVHTQELRDALATLNNHVHTVPAASPTTTLGARNFANWTDPTITPTNPKIRATHLNQLIASIKQQKNHKHAMPAQSYYLWDMSAYDPAMTFTKYPVTTTDKPIASSYEELRTYLEGFATHTHSVCCECECTCTCTCTCTCQCTGDGGGKGT